MVSEHSQRYLSQLIQNLKCTLQHINPYDGESLKIQNLNTFERFLRPQQPAQSMNCTKNAIKIIRDYNKNYKNFGKTKIIKVQLITYE